MATVKPDDSDSSSSSPLSSEDVANDVIPDGFMDVAGQVAGEAEKFGVAGRIGWGVSNVRGLFVRRGTSNDSRDTEGPSDDGREDNRSIVTPTDGGDDLGEAQADEGEDDDDVFNVMRRAISDAKLTRRRIILNMREGGGRDDDFPQPVATLHVYLDRISTKAAGGAEEGGGGRSKLGLGGRRGNNKRRWDDFERVLQFLRDLDGLLRNDVALFDVVQALTGSFRVDLNRTSTLNDLDITLFPLRIRGVMIALHEADGFELVRAYGDVGLNLERRVLEFDYDEIAILGFGASTDLRRKSRDAGASAAMATEEFLERPFRDEIGNNRTSEAMGKVLDAFDAWYFRVLDAAG